MNLFSIDADGTNLRQITEGPFQDSRPPADGGAMEPITPEGYPNSQGLFVDPDGVHLWFHATMPYRLNLHTRELAPIMPPGFTSAWHLTRSRNGIITFDSSDTALTARP